MPPHTLAFLEAILGRMTMEFARGEIRTVAPDAQVPVGAGLRPFAGFQETRPYTVVFCNSSTVAFSSQAAGSEEDEITVFNFVGPDTAWLHTGTTNPKVPDLHMREFFQRIRGGGRSSPKAWNATAWAASASPPRRPAFALLRW